jgi:hypothetical protein
MSSTRVHVWKLASDHTLRPPFARPSSTLVSSANLRAYPGSHSSILGVPSDSGNCWIQQAAGARKFFVTLRTEFSGGG